MDEVYGASQQLCALVRDGPHNQRQTDKFNKKKNWTDSNKPLVRKCQMLDEALNAAREIGNPRLSKTLHLLINDIIRHSKRVAKDNEVFEENVEKWNSNKWARLISWIGGKHAKRLQDYVCKDNKQAISDTYSCLLFTSTILLLIIHPWSEHDRIVEKERLRQGFKTFQTERLDQKRGSWSYSIKGLSHNITIKDIISLVHEHTQPDPDIPVNLRSRPKIRQRSPRRHRNTQEYCNHWEVPNSPSSSQDRASRSRRRAFRSRGTSNIHRSVPEDQDLRAPHPPVANLISRLPRTRSRSRHPRQPTQEHYDHQQFSNPAPSSQRRGSSMTRRIPEDQDGRLRTPYEANISRTRSRPKGPRPHQPTQEDDDRQEIPNPISSRQRRGSNSQHASRISSHNPQPTTDEQIYQQVQQPPTRPARTVPPTTTTHRRASSNTSYTQQTPPYTTLPLSIPRTRNPPPVSERHIHQQTRPPIAQSSRIIFTQNDRSRSRQSSQRRSDSGYCSIGAADQRSSSGGGVKGSSQVRGSSQARRSSQVRGRSGGERGSERGGHHERGHKKDPRQRYITDTGDDERGRRMDELIGREGRKEVVRGYVGR